MFERYTEKARRVVFFARYEASALGSPYIETEHLLLGLLRENLDLLRGLSERISQDDIRRQIESQTLTREEVSTSVDLPLSNESKRVLAYAAKEADRLGERHIGAGHLLIGLLREETTFAATILKQRGLEIAKVREGIASQRGPISVPVRTAEPGGGIIEFLGLKGERVAFARFSRTAFLPRAGELVALDVAGERRRFRVRQVEYDYRPDGVGAENSFNVLYKARIYVTAVREDDQGGLWSAST